MSWFRTKFEMDINPTQYKSKSDHELLDILENFEEYRPEIIEAVKQEIISRGIPIDSMSRFEKFMTVPLEQWRQSSTKGNPADPISISETQAAELFFSSMTDRVFEEWPELLSAFKETSGPKWIPDQLDEDLAKSELLFAAMALDHLALKNLFPPEQAHRLYERCIECIPAVARDTAKFAFEEYGSRFREDVENGQNPSFGVADILYGRWGLAGEAYVPGEFFVAMEPSATLGLAIAAFSYIGVWKQIRTNFAVEDA